MSGVNHYIIASIFNITTVIFLCLFVYSKNPANSLNKVFAFYNLSITFWIFCWLKMIISPNKTEGTLWSRLLHVGAILIPITFLHFVLTMLGNAQKRKKVIAAGYILAFSLILFLFSSRFIPEAIPQFDFNYYTVAGYGYHSFTVFFFLCVIYTLYELFKGYRNSQGLLRNQIKYTFVAYLIGFIGGSTAFLPLFDIPIPKWGLYTISITILILAYTIIRYRLMDINTVIHRTLLWLITSLWLLIPGYFLFKYARDWLQSLSTLWLTLSALGLFYSFLWYYRYFQPRIDHLFRRRKYDYQAILAKVSEKIATTINIEDLSNQLLSEVCETMYLRNGLLFIMDKEEAKFLLIGKRGYRKTNETNYNQAGIASNTSFFKWLLQHQEVLEKEQILVNPRYAQIKQDVIKLFAEHELELMVPLVLENKVNGLLGLGKKENLQPYSFKDTELLTKLGQEAGVTVYNALHYRDLLEKDRLEEEMKLGREIQMALLPKESPQIKNLSISGLMLPAKEIGGDYYDFITLPQEDELGIAIADVSGKGVGAGLIMATVKATLKGLSQQRLSPKQILNHTNNLIYEYTIGQKFITMLYFQYKAKESALYYSSAGHEHILIYHNSSKSIESVMSGGFMLGMIPDIEAYLEEHKIVLEQKDKILLYTDGVTEAENPSGDRFGLERLKESFKAHSDKIPFELIQAVKAQVYEFIGTQPQYDDITLVGMEAG